eukprot:JP441821.1.p3 GENE.JP441821.1~~JP441821.1.p3  ORF type:complete len:53 (+),score=2.91 JP441821.1:123-281(+)
MVKPTREEKKYKPSQHRRDTGGLDVWMSSMDIAQGKNSDGRRCVSRATTRRM